jgi:hypothetical protein
MRIDVRRELDAVLGRLPSELIFSIRDEWHRHWARLVAGLEVGVFEGISGRGLANQLQFPLPSERGIPGYLSRGGNKKVK